MATEYVALLRGINVGGNRPIKMAKLRSLLEQSDFENVRTYIQSGNICFNSSKSRTAIESDLKELILSDFGWEVPVLVRPKSYFKKLLKTNPFSDADVSTLHVTLLSKKPSAKRVADLESVDLRDDEIAIQGDAIFLTCPKGYRNTKLTNNLIESKLGVAATTRNWKTINRIIEL